MWGKSLAAGETVGTRGRCGGLHRVTDLEACLQQERWVAAEGEALLGALVAEEVPVCRGGRIWRHACSRKGGWLLGRLPNLHVKA